MHVGMQHMHVYIYAWNNFTLPWYNMRNGYHFGADMHAIIYIQRASRVVLGPKGPCLTLASDHDIDDSFTSLFGQLEETDGVYRPS